MTGQTVSSKVIESVAALEGVDPLDLEQRLNDVVDPDALDALFSVREESGAERRGAVTFPYCGYTVVVRSSGEVTVEGPDSERRAGGTSHPGSTAE